MPSSVNIKNKRATFEFEVIEKFIAGIVLTGTEIKSVRAGKVSLPDAYCYFIQNELWVKGIHITEYEYGTVYNHDPKRERKLLLNRSELRKLKRKSEEKGFTIIVLRMFINEKGLAKLEIALAKGKHLYDKRQDIRKRDEDRNIRRMLKR